MEKLLPLLLTLLVLLPLEAFSKTAEQRGYEIASEADKRDTGWRDSSANIIMTLRNKQGEESVRENRVRTLEMEKDGDKSIIVFDSPADVKGTAFLSHTHVKKADDQWLYLPALKRIKRISSSNKSGPFMGSEFAYEDISSQELEKYSYKYIKDESVDGREAFVIERYPEGVNGRSLTLAHQVAPPQNSLTPYFVKATQVDGEMAWASPIYVDNRLAHSAHP